MKTPVGTSSCSSGRWECSHEADEQELVPTGQTWCIGSILDGHCYAFSACPIPFPQAPA
jgi:hypothetical protein